MKLAINEGGDLSNGVGESVKVFTSGHDTKEIGVGGIDNAAVVKLFFAGGQKLAFAKLVGDGGGGGEGSGKAAFKLNLTK